MSGIARLVGCLDCKFHKIYHIKQTSNSEQMYICVALQIAFFSLIIVVVHIKFKSEFLVPLRSL